MITMTKNIQTLRTDLVELFYELKTGRVKPPVAVEMNNAAGKAINSAKLELEYIRQRAKDSSLKIEFLEQVQMT